VQDRGCNGKKAGLQRQEGRPATAGRGRARAGAGQGLPQEERARLTAGTRSKAPRQEEGESAAEEGQASGQAEEQAGGMRRDKPVTKEGVGQ